MVHFAQLQILIQWYLFYSGYPGTNGCP